jgi:hypothetical protein
MDYLKSAIEISRRNLIVLAGSACAFLILVPLHASTQNNETVLVEDSEEYAVYSVLLNSEYASDKLQQFVIVNETSGKTKQPFIGFVGGLVRTGAKWPETESETLSDFNTKNENSCLLDRRFDLKTQYVLVTSDKLHTIFVTDAKGNIDSDSWQPFYKRYAGAPGIIAFSRVGFNSSKGQAFVYVANQRGLTSGTGKLFVLSKSSKTWEIRKTVLVWMS